MLDQLRHFRLSDDYELIVESQARYQPDLQADAYFAGIWPEDGPPVARTWLKAESPAEAYRMGQKWADETMPTINGRDDSA